ncbi:hypothetical protein MHF_0875 [Mycoplasma haemofelis Ohio2]|uniref:Lipoprotein n=1 Tax=Mycoplasma haemofelis (strain Ohio2) TaxID=859194 RepID=F6FIT9_MYCHI|nr:hypothetical protein MHF_0875 [Mycoplasma haemofelis Ohio2]
MSKLLLPALGLGGASVAAAGSYAFLSEKKDPVIQKEETFRSKYSQAILESTSNLWDTKFTSLKDGSKPSHPTLILAKDKSGKTETESEAKALHKQGCQTIYESKINDTTYLSDFQTYCAKNLKDAITKTWIADANTESGKWNTKLGSLKDHNSKTNLALDDKLTTLKGQLSKVSGNSWTDEHRKSLKDWCDESQKSIFMGENDGSFKHAQLYCVEGQ